MVKTLFFFCSPKNVFYQGWDSQNACQNTNREDTDKTASESIQKLSDVGRTYLAGN